MLVDHLNTEVVEEEEGILEEQANSDTGTLLTQLFNDDLVRNSHANKPTMTSHFICAILSFYTRTSS